MVCTVVTPADYRYWQRGAIIGVDAEWRLPICNGGKERLVYSEITMMCMSYMCVCAYHRMALMQLAVSDAVYLLDMIALTPLSETRLRSFIKDVFANSATIKLG